MSRQHPNPPVVEVVVDLWFVPGDEWTILIPGRFYDRVRSQFPVVRQVPLEPAHGDAPDDAHPSDFLERIQLVSDDGTRVCQLGQNRISLNSLRPYPGWDQTLPWITDLITAYRDIAQPAGIRTASLRYINQIDVAEANPAIDDYFAFSPHVPEMSGASVQSVFMGTAFQYSEDQDALIVQLVTVEPATPDSTSFVLELTHATRGPAVPDPSGLRDWLDRAHDRIGTAFERIVTDHLRDLMGKDRT